MSAVVTQGKPSTSHGGFWSMPCSVGMPLVRSCGMSTTAAGCFWGCHCDSDSCHCGSALSISSLTKVCGMAITTVGAPVSCGDRAGAGVPLVFAN